MSARIFRLAEGKHPVHFAVSYSFKTMPHKLNLLLKLGYYHYRYHYHYYNNHHNHHNNAVALKLISIITSSSDNIVVIMTTLPGNRISIPGSGNILYPHHRVPTSSVAHPAAHSVGPAAHLMGGRMAEA
jgi:hypothetical protein